MPTILIADPSDPNFIIADTTPTGADPDAMLSFDA